MTYEPRFTITAGLLGLVEEIASLRQRIHDASFDLAWMPALQRDSRMRNAHASTAIEGNPLTLPEVRALAEEVPRTTRVPRSQREVLNYFAGLQYIEQRAADEHIADEHILALHRILATGVMDQGNAGEYRRIYVQVGAYRPPPPAEVPELMAELLDWWNGPSLALSPVISSAIVHYRFEAIHPFGDGNGRTGRTLSLMELYRRGFDAHHILAVDEFYWEDRPRYYAALSQGERAGKDLTAWLEYSAEGLRFALDRAWTRIHSISATAGGQIVLRPKQERLLQLLTAGSMAPSEIWDTLGISRQGAMDLINPLLQAGLIEKVGTRKTGRYRLRQP